MPFEIQNTKIQPHGNCYR